MKTKVSYGKCHVQVVGIDMNCPMCGVLVKSGETHDCEKQVKSPERHAKRLPRKERP